MKRTKEERWALTPAELEIMQSLWAADHPLCKHELLAEPHSYKDSSLYILLTDMMQKGFVRQGGSLVKCGRTYARTFAAHCTIEQYWLKVMFAGAINPDPEKLIRDILQPMKNAGDIMLNVAVNLGLMGDDE